MESEKLRNEEPKDENKKPKIDFVISAAGFELAAIIFALGMAFGWFLRNLI